MAVISIFTLGVIAIGLFSFLVFRHSRKRLYELADAIPGISGSLELPFIGSAHLFTGNTKDIWDVVMHIYDSSRSNGGLAKFWIGPKLFIVISDASNIDKLLNAEMTKPFMYDFMKAWLGNGLVTAPISIWKRHRKMLAPSFGQKILDGFVDVFAEQGEILTNRMANEVGRGTFDVYKYVAPCTLDVICETAMGTKVESQESSKNAAYAEAVNRQTERFIWRTFHLWLHPDWIFKFTSYKRDLDRDVKIAHNFSDEIVKRKTMEYKNKQNEYSDGRERKAFLDSMIEYSESNNTWTNAELREEVDTMTVAGHDTTAQSIGFILVMLACLPKIQEKVVNELKEIYGDSKRCVAKEDLPKMIYLERVIKETLRLFPIGPLIGRVVTKEIKLGKYVLPVGAICGLGIYTLHHDKAVWGEDVEEFDPDRFLPENEAKRDPKAYIPFSVGPRNCIGKQYAMMSMKALVSTVVRKYKLTSDLDYKTIQVKDELVLKPVNGHMISIEHRTDFV